MIFRLMAYAIVVGAVFGATAVMLEQVAALRRVPRRGVWIGALGATVALTMAAPWRATPLPDAFSTAAVLVRPAGHARFAARTSFEDVPWIDRLQSQIDRVDLVRLDPILLDVWILAGFVAAGMYGAALWALARRRRRWRSARVGDLPLLVSEIDGPGVVGVLDSRIVVPEWALSLDPAALDLMLSHEREHQRARDPLPVHGAWLAAVAMPWNPAIWWMVARLKLAIEMDCDARVLARSSGKDDAIAYGEVLLAVAARQSARRPIIAPAMLDHPSSLRRRIAAMFPAHRRFAGARLAGATGASLALLSAALLVPAPTLSARTSAAAGAAPRFVSTVLEPPARRDRAAPMFRPDARTRAQARAAVTSAPLQEPAGGVYEIGNGVSSPAVIRLQNPTYTKAAMDAKIEGEVHLSAVVETNGLLDRVRVTKSLDTVYGLDQAAMDAAKRWLFKPGTKDGNPVPVHVQLILEFRLRSGPRKGGEQNSGQTLGQGPYSPDDSGVIAPVAIRQVDPMYTDVARRAAIQGEVYVSGVVEASGLLSQIRVTKSLDTVYGLDQAAIDAAKRWEFSPGTKDGKAVPVSVDLHFEFKLR